MSHADLSRDDDPRLIELAREYLAELERGVKPDRRQWLAKCPELHIQLNECFDGIELAQALKPVGHREPVSDGNESIHASSPLGDFQIVREIARGGMGIVYEAIQLSLGRRVALKVLPFAAALDQRQLQRFNIEAHAAAQLHHSNIVPVHAVGCERGVHFYAMQLIDGRSLAALIDEWRLVADAKNSDTAAKANTPPTNRPAETLIAGTTETAHAKRSRFREVARIAADVAEALEFAHSAGVVHRDIKPANILLDSQARVWITDFGLAYTTANVSLTRTGEMVGTLRYMSPEQAAGLQSNVDHRADVYSLGATLYELLSLKPIFAAEDRVSLLYQILNVEPAPLRTHDRLIPIELETIVMKALSKSPSDRYATAGAMADDLRRFLAEKPIQARRPTFLDRARKWMRRHPAYAMAATLLLTLGTIGLAIATAVVARQQRITQEALHNEQLRTAEAEAHFEMARRVADELIRIAEEETSDDPFQESLRTRLLETALQCYQEFIEESADKPIARAVLQATSDRVEQILDDLAVLRADRQFFLLREPAVLQDLQVSEAQRSELLSVLRPPDVDGIPGGMPAETSGRRGRRMFDGRRPAPIPRDQLIALAREHEQRLNQILTADQLSRLNQIALQSQGVLALHDTLIVTQLKLTREQRESIKKLEFELRDRYAQERPGPPGPHRLQFGQELRAALQDILTIEQLRLWDQMTGKLIDFEFPPQRPPR